MADYLEWDIDNPAHRSRCSRPQVEVLEAEAEPRIHVEVRHRYVPRQRQQMPPWLVALLIIAAIMWISPFGAIVTIIMGAALVTAHPTIAIVLGIGVALVIIIALRERWYGRPF
jgi:hypothetical protein